MVLIDKTRYIEEALRQLNGRRVYVALDGDPTKDMIKKVNEQVNRLHLDGHISDKTLGYLLVNSTARAPFTQIPQEKSPR